MLALEVRDMGVKFRLHHEVETTLTETVIELFRWNGRKKNAKKTSDEEFWPLRNISFSVNSGESVGVIGKNGAGKSTLLQVLTGIYKPDEGIVVKNGNIGLLQLGTGFHPELTGRDNIYLNGAILGLAREEIDSVYHAIIDFSELHDFIDTPLRNYSSGMVSRLGFSIAINIRPDILLIDEVLSVGDEGFRRKCSDKIEELRGAGRTIVFVSHSMGEVTTLCERAICLDHGKILFDGGSNEVSEFYLELIAKEGA